MLPVLALEWIAGPAFAGATTEAVGDTMKWVVRALVLVVLLTFVVRAAWRAGLRPAGRWLALGVAGLLLALTLRAGIRLCYMNYDLATEHLSYAQGTPDVKRAMREIELISERSAGDRELFVAYDDQSSWPFVWYLRDYPKSRTWGTQAQFAQGAAVIITGPKNRDGAWPLVADGYVKREYRLIWWPVQEYSNKGPRDLVQLLRDPARRHLLWRMAMYHDYSHMDAVKWDPRQDFDMYVRDDVAPLGLAALGLGDTAGAGGGSTASSSSSPAVTGGGTRLEPQPRAILTGPFDGVALAGPTDIAIAPDGARVIADAGNHRIVVLERDGTLRTAFGGKCDVAQAATSGCVDPDGSGPLEVGDGQFNEPWGVAVGPTGQIFVSDTWNHRVERFDASGRFSGKWGHFGNSPVAGGPAVEEPIFYGPRGISDGFDGELVVSDTGNKRLLVFSPDGGLQRTIGSGGAGPDQWNEPVGIAPDQNGTLLVADTWNRRVKRLDRRYAAIASWRVPDWRSEGVSDKPYVVADDDGMVYAGDPTGGRVWIFAPSGRLEGTLVLPALVSGKPRPLGMAIDVGAARAPGGGPVRRTSPGVCAAELEDGSGAVLSAGSSYHSDLGESRRRPAGRRGRSGHRVSPRRSRRARRRARGCELVVVRRRGGRGGRRHRRARLALAASARADRAHRHRASLLGHHDRLLRQRCAADAAGRADARGRDRAPRAAASTSRPRWDRSRSSACSTWPARSRSRRWWCRSRAASAAESRRGPARLRW